MHMIDQDPMNTFVFSEKDLPGYRAYSADRAPPRFRDRKRIAKAKKPEFTFRRAIPSTCITLQYIQAHEANWGHSRTDCAHGTSLYGDQLSAGGEQRLRGLHEKTGQGGIRVEAKDSCAERQRWRKHTPARNIGSNCGHQRFYCKANSSFTPGESTDRITRQKPVRVVGRSRPTKPSGFRQMCSWIKS